MTKLVNENFKPFSFQDTAGILANENMVLQWSARSAKVGSPALELVLAAKSYRQSLFGRCDFLLKLSQRPGEVLNPVV